ncbi:MAG: alcohol dehydrogenase, partial [Spirochaetia bacterium]|nr:alcohol dehydrogenase [Spirochaetia bacterium]
MKAVSLEKPWSISLVEKERPVPQIGEALIKVKSVGICGSDIGAFRGTNQLVSYPRIIGHEIAGEIVEIPSDNPKGFVVGDRVVVDPYLYCGHCYPCSIGRTNCCTNLNVLGVHVDGG